MRNKSSAFQGTPRYRRPTRRPAAITSAPREALQAAAGALAVVECQNGRRRASPAELGSIHPQRIDERKCQPITRKAKHQRDTMRDPRQLSAGDAAAAETYSA
ncbi:hypothetical protein MTO96_011971 [Rhipicephalus appendiculatus]